MKTSVMFLLLALATVSYADKTEERQIIQTLKNFKSFRNDFTSSGNEGKYAFAYHVGDSERAEERNEEGEVSGQYAFVAPEGDEYEFKYNADEEGYRVESDALPEAPEDTDDVKKAKEEFFQAYQKALERAEEDDYEYSEESDEDSDEDSEDSDEESSEESSEEDDDDEEDEEEPVRGASPFGFRVPIPYNRK
ncbi:larval cuticle protein 4-like [Macrobrachium nipponense]|uniref:larval cuticle protein 4-like n=1 Tax=Macrobrachium nipponense TaxID=159736 RepID=UPI0030C87C39